MRTKGSLNKPIYIQLPLEEAQKLAVRGCLIVSARHYANFLGIDISKLPRNGDTAFMDGQPSITLAGVSVVDSQAVENKTTIAPISLADY